MGSFDQNQQISTVPTFCEGHIKAGFKTSFLQIFLLIIALILLLYLCPWPDFQSQAMKIHYESLHV